MRWVAWGLVLAVVAFTVVYAIGCCLLFSQWPPRTGKSPVHMTPQEYAAWAKQMEQARQAQLKEEDRY